MKKYITLAFIAVAALLMNYNTSFAATGLLQSEITYYTKNDGSSFIRSKFPFTSGEETQVDNPDGSVTVSINNSSGYADSGFAIYNGKLGDLKPFTLNGTGEEYGLNLWFDVDNNGEYFNWNSSNVLTDLGNDKYILGPSSNGGTISLTDSSQFTSLIPGGGNYTLAQLKAGNAPGISSNTSIAIWVGVTVGNGGSKSATISLLAPSPTSIDQCKNGGWENFDNPSFKNQGQCIGYVVKQNKPTKVTGDIRMSNPKQRIIFSAFDYANNPSRDKGNVEYWNFDYPGLLHYKAKVLCADIDKIKNEARFMFQIPDGWLGLSGLYVVSYVKDNGNPGTKDLYGHVATSDPNIAKDWCENGTSFTMYPIVGGNLVTHK